MFQSGGSLLDHENANKDHNCRNGYLKIKLFDEHDLS
jgi:hypothetical protein